MAIFNEEYIKNKENQNNTKGYEKPEHYNDHVERKTKYLYDDKNHKMKDINIENNNKKNESSIIDNDFIKIKSIVESEDWKASYKDNFNDYYTQLNEADAISMGLVAAGVVLFIIKKLIDWVKGKYSLTVKKLLNHTKELNDIYTKVNDLLAHDKMARFKHRNDRYDAEVHSAVMVDKKDPSKVYKLYIDNLAYNPDYFIKQLNDIMRYADAQSKKDRANTITTMVDSLIADVNKGFMENRGYVITCTPFMKVAKYANQKLESVIMNYKEWIEFIYQALAIYNNNTSWQLQYLQLLEQAYKKMLNDYGKDKDSKAAVDKLFKALIKNVTASMDFNAKSMVIFNDMIKHYSDELHKIYDIIRA
jgi:hypothetical protein